MGKHSNRLIWENLLSRHFLFQTEKNHEKSETKYTDGSTRFRTKQLPIVFCSVAATSDASVKCKAKKSSPYSQTFQFLFSGTQPLTSWLRWTEHGFRQVLDSLGVALRPFNFLTAHPAFCCLGLFYLSFDLSLSWNRNERQAGPPTLLGKTNNMDPICGIINSLTLGRQTYI